MTKPRQRDATGRFIPRPRPAARPAGTPAAGRTDPPPATGESGPSPAAGRAEAPPAPDRRSLWRRILEGDGTDG